MLRRVSFSLVLLLAVGAWGQTDSTTMQPASPFEEPTMVVPPPVSGQNYPSVAGSEERSNYLHYGVSFNSAYSDNALGGSPPVGDASYSIWPSIALDQRTSRLHTVLNYNPGFTFYQKTSARNEMDQNLSINLTERLSPHVTLTASDGLQKSSSVFNQLNYGSGGVSGGGQSPNGSVIAPVSPLLNNTGNVGIAYQYAANAMIGASGTFGYLHYFNSEQVSGLADSNSQAASVYYSLRISKLHYIGANYQYQRLISTSPTEGQSETQTHAIVFYYTLYPTSRVSLSAFGGPQYSNTAQGALFGLPLPPATAWNPSVGGSAAWQGELTSVAVSYSHAVSGGGGLSGAAKMDAANLSLHRQLTRTLNASLSGGYTQNKVLQSSLFGNSNDGHTIIGTATLAKQLGEHLGLQLGYTRLHQNYSSVAILASTPDTNRGFITISYTFSRPLGR